MRRKNFWCVVAFVLWLSASASSGAEKGSVLSNVRFVIGTVQADAENGNLSDVAKFMSEKFQYSLGGSRSKNEALSYYREHPVLLREMARIIAQGCRLTILAKQQYYVCPPQAADPQVIYVDYRAGFRRQPNGEWVFEFFVRGE